MRKSFGISNVLFYKSWNMINEKHILSRLFYYFTNRSLVSLIFGKLIMSSPIKKYLIFAIYLALI